MPTVGDTEAELFHIALPDDWARAVVAGAYERSTRGRSLADEGFVHCSRRDQVEQVANLFYADLAVVTLLTLDVTRLGVPVVDEPVVDEHGAPGAVFPHVYGPIAVAAVVSAVRWERGPDGRFSLP